MTIGIAVTGPDAGLAAFEALRAVERVSRGAIGGFVSFVAIGAEGSLLRAQTQRGGTRTLFTRGFPWLGATRNDQRGVPDAEFFAWLGQVQWAARFPELFGLQVVAPAHHRRIAAGILSWGQDMDFETSPFQVNLGYQVPRGKSADYIGKRELERQRASICH